MLNRINQKQFDEPNRKKPLRLWPGVVIVVVQWLVRFIVPIIEPDALVFAVFGGLFGGLAVVVWWAFFSRAPWFERLGAVVLMIVAMVGTSFILHESIDTANMGLMYVVFAIPVLSLAFVIWAVASQRLSDRIRRVTMAATILLACGVWALLRTEGMTADGRHDLAWRWAETREEHFLTQVDDELTAFTWFPEIMETKAVWPGFRGLNRDGIISKVRIETDWTVSPPVELWRRPIGPGCSSFAVWGSVLYTQEQRGEYELVVCYNLNTGEPVWRHRDKARFWDSHAGAGPRATPTISDGRVYTFGATGILNALNARDGSIIWSRNAASDTDTKIPGWGFTSSPLVVENVVIVAVEGTLAAYDITNGEPRWFGPNRGKGYSSPHLLTIDGTAQVLLMSEVVVISVAAADGTVLWEHSWPKGERIVQPALIETGDILISSDDGGSGMRRLSVAYRPNGWTIEERWTSRKLTPIFNDFIVHKGHAFGFNGYSLACIDIENGERKWREGRYGGQIILLADQDLLLVLSEKGELALVKATPDRFKELARFPAIEGKTWNHPVLVGDILLVRNSQEMAAFRLSLTGN